MKNAAGYRSSEPLGDDAEVSTNELLAMVHEVLAEHAEWLERDGWAVQITANDHGNVIVRVAHELFSTDLGLLPGMSAERAKRFLEASLADSEFARVREAPVRPEVSPLVGKMRAVARCTSQYPHSDYAVMGVAYALLEEGVLLREEVEWLQTAVDADIARLPRERTVRETEE